MMLEIIENSLRSVNKQHDEIDNPLAKFAYTFLVQLPLNVLAKASEIVTEPFKIFGNHVLERQRDTAAYVPNNTRGQHIINLFALFKKRAALTLKLPVDLITGLIKTVLFFPRFIVAAPLSLLNNCILFLSKYVKKESTPQALKYALTMLQMLIFVPTFLLNQMDKVLHRGLFEKRAIQAYAQYRYDDESFTKWLQYSFYKNLSVAGVLSVIENAVNTAITNVARLLVEVPLLPITAFLHASNFIGSKFATQGLNVEVTREPGATEIELVPSTPAQSLSVELTGKVMLPSGGPISEVTEPEMTEVAQDVSDLELRERRSSSPSRHAINL